MSLQLKACNVDPEQYVEITEHNLKIIDNIENEIIINNLVKMLAAISKIDYQICLLDLKSYLMINHSYPPFDLAVKPKNIFLYLRFVASHLFHGFRPKRAKQFEVIIDDWTDGIVLPFYGDELISQLKTSYVCGIERFRCLRFVNLIHVFRSLLGFIKCMFLAEKIIRAYRADLREYVFIFFSEFLSGLAIREANKPKLIITGHQNGFSSIKAKAAGAEIIFIPNGVFGYFGDTAFKYADHFISVGGKYFDEAALKFGCVFKNIHSFGPIRVYNFNQKTKGRNFKVIYDLLWVGCGIDLLSNYLREGFDVKTECEAIKLINCYAAKNGAKIAYHCRTDTDVEKLKKLGLFSEKITYLPPTYSENGKETKNIYEAVKESRIVMASVSGVFHEALTFGKKAAIVNMSGNDYLYYPYRNTGLEYNLSSKISFDEFVEEIENREVDLTGHVVQNPNYVRDLLSIVEGIVNKSEVKDEIF